MAHDVFISYSTTDKVVADAVCASLEARKIRCWIAPRDVPPGATWAVALVEAIGESRVFVLVFSDGSNRSTQVIREVAEAVDSGIPVIPLRIEDVKPSKGLGYYIKAVHWLDALTPPLEAHLQRLGDTVQALLGARPAEEPPVPTAVTVERQAGVEKEARREERPLAPAPRPAKAVAPSPKRGKMQMGMMVGGVLGILLVVLVVTAIALQPRSSKPTPTMAPAATGTIGPFDMGGREITVGSDAAYPPFEFQDGEGNIIGFDVDLVNAICEVVNCKATFVRTAWDRIFVALAAGEFDIVASCVTCTGSPGEERRQVMDFADSYLTNGQVVLVRDDEQEIKGTEDLSGHKVGAQVGTPNEALAIGFAGEDNYRPYDTVDAAVFALLNGALDAVIIDKPAADLYLTIDARPLREVGEPFNSIGLCIAVRKGDTAMRDALNQGLAQVKAMGKLNDLVRYWLTKWKPEE